MFESRCGVRCDLCERKEEVHCTGCIEMAAPFWGGTCEVMSMKHFDFKDLMYFGMFILALLTFIYLICH